MVQMVMTDYAVAVMLGHHPPREFRLQDMSNFAAGNTLAVMLDAVLGSGSAGPLTFPGVALWRNLVRLTDQALREHEVARGELNKWLNSGNNTVSPYFRAVDAMEQCIVATHRAMVMAGALKDQRLGRGAPRPTQARRQKIAAIRNAIIHTDERLTGTRRPAITPAEPSMLRPLESHLQLGVHRLTYVELGGAIRGCCRMIETMRGV